MFDRLKCWLIYKLVNAYVVVFKRRDGAIVINGSMLSSDDLQTIGYICGKEYFARKKDELAEEAEEAVKELMG